MSEYMVEVGLNLQADQYVTTMGQAINLTKQYSDVAAGVPGAVQNLTKSMTNATMAVTGFNKVNGVALDTAAQYEKQLSQIEAVAKISGQSFDKLSKTTRGWAREFPIGMNQAVEVMETLQKQGIKSEKQMADLGKSMIKLGAATGTRPGALGEQMLQLTRTMGNGLSQFEKLSDSVITTTNRIGGSAPAVVAFSKALAPVASTVGISQTAITGLSAAMSRLGEDGGFAAQAFNKVMLDMNRAIRDGGPELKAYADLLGTTTERLRGMWKTDPTEVLTQFSEGVAKQGPDVSRTLDALGFDTIRTAQSLTALARSGTLRQAVETSVAGYGDGSTSKAAETALDGVADQAERLRETMSQVVADVGQPLLGFGRGVLSASNAVASGAQAVTGSSVGQNFFGVTGVGSAAASVAGSIVPVATLAALSAMALKWFKGSDVYANFKQGGMDARAGMGEPTRGGMASTMGFARQAGMMGVYGLGAGGANQQGSGAGMGRLAARMSGWALETGARYQATAANMMSALAPGPRIGVTPEMQGLRNDGREAARDLRSAVRNLDGAGVRDATSRLRDIGGAYARTYDVGAARGAANLAAASAFVPVRAAVGLAAGGVRAGGALASALGLSGGGMLAMGGLVAGGAVAMKAAEQQQGYDMAKTRSRDLNSDVYSRFNNFAEATGQAGKGIVSFTAQVQESTSRIMKANTTFDQAYTLSADEAKLARSSGYTTAIEFMGTSRTPQSIATNIISTLGPQASPEDIGRALTDVQKYNQSSYDEVAAIIKDFFGDSGVATKSLDVNALAKDIGANKTRWDDLLGIKAPNATQGDIASQLVSFAGMRAAQNAGKYGGSVRYSGGQIGADEATRLLEARRVFTEFDAESADDSAQRALTGSIADILGLSEEEANKAGLGTGFFDSGAFKTTGGGIQLTGEQAFQRFLKNNPDIAEKFAAVDKSGSSISATGEVTLGAQFNSIEPESQRALKDYFGSFETTAGVTSVLGDAMRDLTDVVLTQENAYKATDVGMTPGREQLGRGDMALLEFSKDQASSQKRQAAVESILDRLVKSTGGDYAQARAAAMYAQAQAGEGTVAQAALSGVLEQLGIKQGVAQAGRSGILDLLDQYRIGRQAQSAPVNSNTSSVKTDLVLSGMQAQDQMLTEMVDFNRAFGALQTNIAATRRSGGVSIAGVRAQAAMATRQAQEDYDIQDRYAKQDYRRQRRYATRDFNTQQRYAREDYGTTVMRAERDFNIQKDRSDRDFNKQMQRSEEDYLKQRERAFEDFGISRERSTRDYNLSIFRAQRDFEKSSSRAEVDYLKARNRSVEDFNKSMARAAEDGAKQMYDPFKRIQAAMVMDAGQLLSNLKDQQRALDKQVGDLAQARRLGVTEETIKALGLADAQNAQQLSRLVGDLAGNTDLADQLNAAVAGKANSAQALFTDQGNVQFARAQEDMATQLARMDEDFSTSQQRARDDFAASMSDAATDFATAMEDALSDFSKSMDRMTDDYLLSRKRVTDDYGQSIIDMTDDHRRGLEDMAFEFEKQMKRTTDEFEKQMRRMESEFDRSRDRALAALELAQKRIADGAALQIRQIGASIGAAITSMEDSFYGMLQNSKTGLAGALQFVETIRSSKRDISDMRYDIQDMYKAALEMISGANMGVTRDRVGADAFKEFKGADKTPEPFDESKKLSMQDRAAGVFEGSGNAWVDAGASVWSGFMEGLMGAMRVMPIIGPFIAMYDAVTQYLEINSPSRLFEGVGASVAEGLLQGIQSGISGAWNAVTAPIANLDIRAKVESAFAATGTYLGGLGSRIDNTWIGKGWEGLMDGLGRLEGTKTGSLMSKVTDVFSDPKSWLEGLRKKDNPAVSQPGR
jgi:TP901 family phage tail tape measure protein